MTLDKETKQQEANRVINALGGTLKVSGICEVTTGAVSQWRVTGIPNARRQFLALKAPELFLSR